MENVLLLEIKQLYDSLVAAPYGEYVHGYGTQKPNGFKYKSNAQTLFNKVVELNEKCRPSYIDEQTIFQLSHTLEKEVEHVVGTYEEAIKPNAAQKRWQELDDKMNRATRQIHLGQLIPVIDTAVMMFVNVTHKKLIDETIMTHRMITEAIANHDPIGAKAAMVMHLNFNRSYIKKVYDGEDPDDGTIGMAAYVN